MCIILGDVDPNGTEQLIVAVSPTQHLVIYRTKMRLKSSASFSFSSLPHPSGFASGTSAVASFEGPFGRSTTSSLATILVAVPGRPQDIIMSEAVMKIGNEVLNACVSAFPSPAPLSASSTFSFGGDMLPVQTFGSYKCSVVPDYRSLQRIDMTQIPISRELLEGIAAEYKDGCFIAASFIAGAEYMPFAYLHGAPQDKNLFFSPCLHAHGTGRIADMETGWDHTIYVAGVEQVAAVIGRRIHSKTQSLTVLGSNSFRSAFGSQALLGSDIVAKLVDAGVKIQRGKPLVLSKIEIRGTAMNGDVYIRGKACVNDGSDAKVAMPTSPTAAFAPASSFMPSLPLHDDTLMAAKETKTEAKQASTLDVTRSFNCDCCLAHMAPTAARMRCIVCPDTDVCMACMNDGSFKRIAQWKQVEARSKHKVWHVLSSIQSMEHLASRVALNKSGWKHSRNCDKCKQPIVGFRWLCTVCGIDLCDECDQRVDLHDPSHSVLRMAPTLGKS